MSVNQDDVILEDFGRNVSAKSSALFYGNALIVSVLPIWLYWRIHHVEPSDLTILFGLVTLIATYGISFAYRNTKFQLKHGFAQEREDAIRKEMNNKLANDKKMSRKEKDERILWKKNEVADYEATSYSIFYNNALFLTIFLFASFFLLRSFSPSFNYVLSTGLSVGIIALLSTGTK